MWAEKYRPSGIENMVGNAQERAGVVEWFSKWKKGTRPLLLLGPPGIGKTTIAYLAAKRFGYDLIGLNASDARSKGRINEILGPVLGNESVHGNPMIFVDEADGIHGKSDYGGAEALIKILKEPAVPILVAANSDDSAKMKSLSKAVSVVRFRPIPPRLLKLHLEGVLAKEGASMSPGSMIMVIRKSRGDLRSMLNIAQSMVSGFNPEVSKSFEKLNVEDGINAFYKAKEIGEARSVLDSMRIDPRDKIAAFYSTVISGDLDAVQMRNSLRALADADILYGRITKTQQWRQLRYLDAILIRLFIPGTSLRYAQYGIPWPLLNRIRWDGAALKNLYLAMRGRLHVSRSTFATIYLPYILYCMKHKATGILPDGEYTEILEKEMARIP